MKRKEERAEDRDSFYSGITGLTSVTEKKMKNWVNIVSY